MRNILVQYKGGGYDGCMWEWNYALFDKEGKFYSIYNTGNNGCTSKQQLVDLTKDKENEIRKDFYLYNFSNVQDLKQFSEESNVQNILGVAQWIEKNQPNISENYIPLICGYCKEDKNSDDIKLNDEDYCGDGGIGVQYNSLICSSCNAIYSCAQCGEFYGKDNDELNDVGMCKYCMDKMNTTIDM